MGLGTLKMNPRRGLIGRSGRREGRELLTLGVAEPQANWEPSALAPINPTIHRALSYLPRAGACSRAPAVSSPAPATEGAFSARA